MIKFTDKKGKPNIPVILITVVVAVVVILFLVGLYSRWKDWEEQKSRLVNNSVPNVRVMVAQPEDGVTELTLPGFVVGYNVTPVLARTNGYLSTFYVDIGDEVVANQLLCKIETPDVDAEWLQAKNEVVKAVAEMDIAKITADRWAGLYQKDPESISKQQVDETEAQYKAAVAVVDAAQAHFEYLDVLKNFKFVFSPYDGIVVERNIDIGSLVSAGNESMTQPYTIGFEVVSQPLFKIADIKTVRVFVDVPQPYYPFIEDGVVAQVSIPEYPDKVFSGSVDRNAVALDVVSRTLLTQVNIENQNNMLRPGLFTEVKFAFKPYKDSFNIPVGALIIRDGPPFLAVLNEDNIVSVRQVQIGRDYGKSIQIIKGISAGDRVILNPNYRIIDGIKVNIMDMKQ